MTVSRLILRREFAATRLAYAVWPTAVAEELTPSAVGSASFLPSLRSLNRWRAAAPMFSG
jgi:hypothetical protein